MVMFNLANIWNYVVFPFNIFYYSSHFYELLENMETVELLSKSLF